MHKNIYIDNLYKCLRVNRNMILKLQLKHIPPEKDFFLFK